VEGEYSTLLHRKTCLVNDACCSKVTVLMERTVSPSRSVTGQRCGPSLPHEHIITVTLEVTSNTKALWVCASEVEHAVYELLTLLLG